VDFYFKIKILYTSRIWKTKFEEQKDADFLPDRLFFIIICISQLILDAFYVR